MVYLCGRLGLVLLDYRSVSITDDGEEVDDIRGGGQNEPLLRPSTPIVG